MIKSEAELWETLSQSRKARLEPSWLGEAYSVSLPYEIRKVLCERLGILASEGWPIIKQLVNDYVAQPELIHAAGLCHQPAAYEWLLQQLQETDLEASLTLLKALKCWGAEISCNVISQSLKSPSQAHRIAGLDLLMFKAYQLDDKTLLQLCEVALADWRDPVAIAAVRILQRRGSPAICKRLANLCHQSYGLVAKTALLALGCISTPTSRQQLLELSETLSNPKLSSEARKQLGQQF